MRRILFALSLLGSAACGNGLVQDVCGPQVVCPAGGHFALCTQAAGSAAYYSASDGTNFQCLSGSDCQDARREVTAWCQQH